MYCFGGCEMQTMYVTRVVCVSCFDCFGRPNMKQHALNNMNNEQLNKLNQKIFRHSLEVKNIRWEIWRRENRQMMRAKASRCWKVGLFPASGAAVRLKVFSFFCSARKIAMCHHVL